MTHEPIWFYEPVSMFAFMTYCIYIMTLWQWKQIDFVIQSNENFLFPLSSLLIRQSRSLLLYVSYLWKQNLLSVSLSLSEQWNVWEMCVAFFILADKSASDCSADPLWNHHLLPSNSFWQKCWQNIQSRWQFCNQHHNLSWEIYILASKPGHRKV